MVNKWLIGGVSVLVIIVDQLTKWLIRQSVTQPIPLTRFLEITNIQNTGIGFGLLQGYGWILTIVIVLIVGVLLWYYPRVPQELLPQITYAFIIGGAVGNLIDRLVFGKVTDFISFSFWPAFNVADTAITLGVIGLLIHYWIRGERV